MSEKSLQNIKYILLDIEGTVSSIDFVKKTLFPYARKHLASFVKENPGLAEKALEETKQTMIEEKSAVTSEIDQLLAWIDEDRKHPALKSLQGMIWKRGFEEKSFSAPLYADVLPAWQVWRERGCQLGIYSSGSVAAQKLFFAHTEEGDLSAYISNHFDLEIGSKKESSSYIEILKVIEHPASEVLFLSDIEAELQASHEAGLLSIQVVREGTEASKLFKTVTDFTSLC